MSVTDSLQRHPYDYSDPAHPGSTVTANHANSAAYTIPKQKSDGNVTPAPDPLNI